LGESLFKQKKFREAIDSYSQALQVTKEKEIILNSLYESALCWENLGNWEKQGEILEKFIERFPEHGLASLAHLKLANSLFNREKIAQAREHYSYVVKTTEESQLAVEAQFRMGDGWFNEKKFDKAIVEYLRVPILYPQYKEWGVKAQFRVGRCYEALGKFEEAKKTYQKILQVESLKEEYRNDAQERLRQLEGR